MKKILYSLRNLLLGIVAFVALYALTVVTLSRIPLHANFASLPTDQAGVDIYVRTNGVHTDIVLPAKTAIRDWSNMIPPADLHNTDGHLSYISFGWGDKGFYLDTPTWAELKASTAFIAATGLGSTAMHIEAIEQPKISPTIRHLRISEAAFQSIVADIDRSFKFDAHNQVEHINTTANYNDHDAFYEATGRYSIFTTCNEWTRKTLAHAGIKTAAFSPLQDGVMRFLP
ncbi:hypothetical protein DTO96_101033 [Ephemeroptericola cinctiostellae]|uniref:TIGR02117 family protein n=1 Tax=Ephemeroptericola cinctiostellae TaxID=2268024 RepID=A0A345DAB5_9BURK|nr:TIGR02117 family protein [Ephemeroptericola cinctiostellae]AXF85303.1 hypothetical protein DTO96_101033 [Ephemeroptericola cinctiostellae]